MWWRRTTEPRWARSGWPGGVSGSKNWTRGEPPAEPRLQRGRASSLFRAASAALICPGLRMRGCHCLSRSPGACGSRGAAPARTAVVRHWRSSCSVPSRPECRGRRGLWSLVDAARHCSDPDSPKLLVHAARTTLSDVPSMFPRKPAAHGAWQRLQPMTCAPAGVESESRRAAALAASPDRAAIPRD